MPFIINSILFRSLALYSLYEPITFVPLLRGFLSDFLQCIPFILICNIINNKYGKFIVFIIFSLLISANTEHIIVNKGNITYHSILFITDEQFITGSALSFRVILMFISSCFLLILLQLSATHLNEALSRLPHHFRVRKPVLFLTAITLTTLTPISVFNPSWQQQSLLEQNVSSYIQTQNNSQYISNSSYTDINDIKKKNAQYHLLNAYEVKDGTSFLNELKPEKNILLIFVEGLSQHQMTDNTLKQLQQLGQENFSAQHFITSQRQTNRGLYATFCAKYPNLISKIAKADIVGTLGPDTLCLPEILKQNGFETVFLQSADLSFMRKDLFAQEIGFSQVYGNPTWINAQLKTAWGIDDLTLYDSAIYKIAELNKQNKKWFMSLLTVSTHHPYQFPGSAKMSTYEDALRFADFAVNSFIEKLRAKNILDNTLVIIISDEANGTGDVGLGRSENHNSNFLSDNHGPFVALGKRIPKQTTQAQVFSQVDIPVTILDYLKIENPKPIGGRSIFRKYNNAKKVFFGNVYRDFFGYFESTNKMVLCQLNISCSQIKLADSAFSGNTFQFLDQKAIDIKETAFIKNIIDINDIYSSNLKGKPLFSEKDKIYQGKLAYEIISKFKIMGNEDKPLKIDFTIDNTLSKTSQDLTLAITAGSYKSKSAQTSEIKIHPGELKSFVKTLLLNPNEYYWLDIYVIAMNTEKWNANSIQIH